MQLVLQDCFPDPYQFLQESFQLVEVEHVGAIAEGFGGIRVGFDEQPVGSGRDGGPDVSCVAPLVPTPSRGRSRHASA